MQRPCGMSELGILLWRGKKPVWLGTGCNEGMESRIKGCMRGKHVLDHIELCESGAVYLCIDLFICKFVSSRRSPQHSLRTIVTLSNSGF